MHLNNNQHKTPSPNTKNSTHIINRISGIHDNNEPEASDEEFHSADESNSDNLDDEPEVLSYSQVMKLETRSSQSSLPESIQADSMSNVHEPVSNNTERMDNLEKLVGRMFKAMADQVVKNKQETNSRLDTIGMDIVKLQKEKSHETTLQATIKTLAKTQEENTKDIELTESQLATFSDQLVKHKTKTESELLNLKNAQQNTEKQLLTHVKITDLQLVFGKLEASLDKFFTQVERWKDSPTIKRTIENVCSDVETCMNGVMKRMEETEKRTIENVYRLQSTILDEQRMQAEKAASDSNLFNERFPALMYCKDIPLQKQVCYSAVFL